jgi:hypothetical protein
MRSALSKSSVAVVALIAISNGSPSSAQIYANNASYTTCYVGFQTGAPEFRTIKIRRFPIFKFEKGNVWANNASNRLADTLEKRMLEDFGPSEVNTSACNTYRFEEDALRNRPRSGVEMAWPFDPMEELARFLAADYAKRAGASTPPSGDPKPTKPLAPKDPDASSKSNLPVEPATPPAFIEVAGPDGKTIRLSPEVAARNKQAQEEYDRKMKAYEAEKARYAAEQARHAEGVAQAAAKQREYERQLEAYKTKPTSVAGTEGTFKATSAFRATKDEAMGELTGGDRVVTNIRCKEVTFYKPARWTCWGTYRDTVSQSATSKQ